MLRRLGGDLGSRPTWVVTRTDCPDLELARLCRGRTDRRMQDAPYRRERDGNSPRRGWVRGDDSSGQSSPSSRAADPRSAPSGTWRMAQRTPMTRMWEMAAAGASTRWRAHPMLQRGSCTSAPGSCAPPARHGSGSPSIGPGPTTSTGPTGSSPRSGPDRPTTGTTRRPDPSLAAHGQPLAGPPRRESHAGDHRNPTAARPRPLMNDRG
jgi:hypothetical protein